MERMSEYKKEVNQDNQKHSWCIMEKLDQQSIQQEEEEEETSTISNGSLSSCSSSDTIDEDDDDASSLSSSSSSLTSAGSSLLDLSDLMSQLPIKRGLSKFYHGKSESFTSLARVMSIEDLPKKMNNPYNQMNKKKMKANNKGRGGGLDSYKAHTLPKPFILKKSSPFLRQRSFARSTLIPGQLKTTSGFQKLKKSTSQTQQEVFWKIFG